jgi:hypothetical protein
LKGLEYAGLRSMAYGGVGGALAFIVAPALGGITISAPLIGGALTSMMAGLATVATVLGAGLLVIALVPLAPRIYEQVKGNLEAYRKKVEAKCLEAMQKMEVSPIIAAMLNSANERTYEAYRGNFNADVEPAVEKLEKSRRLLEAAADGGASLASRFEDYLK